MGIDFVYDTLDVGGIVSCKDREENQYQQNNNHNRCYDEQDDAASAESRNASDAGSNRTGDFANCCRCRLYSCYNTGSSFRNLCPNLAGHFYRLLGILDLLRHHLFGINQTRIAFLRLYLGFETVRKHSVDLVINIAASGILGYDFLRGLLCNFNGFSARVRSLTGNELCGTSRVLCDKDRVLGFTNH